MEKKTYCKYRETCHQMIEMILELNHPKLPEEMPQWILRHVFIDIFEATREYLYFLFSTYERNSKVSPWDNLALLIEKTSLVSKDEFSEFHQKCKDFNDLRNHLVHRGGIYYEYDESGDNKDLDFTFPACPHPIKEFLKLDSDIPSRLDGHNANYPYGEAVNFRGRDVVNLILFMSLTTHQITEIVSSKELKDKFIDYHYFIKLKYIYDAF